MSRKSEDFSGRLKAYESGQHPHAIGLGYLLVVHSKKGGFFKRQKKTQLLTGMLPHQRPLLTLFSPHHKLLLAIL